MKNNVIILKPRLDIPFGFIKDIPKTRGAIPSIRKYWEKLSDYLFLLHKSRGDQVQIIEKPLWQFNAEFVLKLDYTKIYIPHHSIKTFDKENKLENVFYYMQMVFPWLFQIDSKGWCADATVWPIEPTQNSDGKIFKKYQSLAFEGHSKFKQPKRGQFKPQNKYILFLCQIPHDQTITLHSDVSVVDALLKTIEISKLLGIQLIVKPHPINKDSMKPLLEIVSRKNLSGEKILWADIVNIHDLLEHCEAVFSVNSGGGMEGILHKKPIFCFGRSDYSSVSHFVDKSINWEIKDKFIPHYEGFIDAYVNTMVNVNYS